MYGSGFVGGAITATYCVISVNQSIFENNRAGSGGAIFASYSIVAITNSVFTINSAAIGGALSSIVSNITIRACEFYSN